jgi:hypothetical protein
MPVQVVNAILIFFHVVMPLMYLDLPESWTCLRWSFVSYAICHGLVHFSSQLARERQSAGGFASAELIFQGDLLPFCRHLSVGSAGVESLPRNGPDAPLALPHAG